jgi:hypothetical protein
MSKHWTPKQVRVLKAARIMYKWLSQREFAKLVDTAKRCVMEGLCDAVIGRTFAAIYAQTRRIDKEIAAGVEDDAAFARNHFAGNHFAGNHHV